jgi:hypothetical protein
MQALTHNAQRKNTRSDKIDKPKRCRKDVEYLGLAGAWLVHEENPGETRLSSPKLKSAPCKTRGVTLVTNGGTAAVPPAAASGAAPVKKNFSQGGARLLDKGHKVGQQAHPPGHPRKGRP